MRIAIFHNLPSGGAKRSLAETVRRLAAQHDIWVYTLSSADHEFGDLRPYAACHKVFDFAPAPLLQSPWGRLNQGIRLFDLFRLESVAQRVAAVMLQDGFDVALIHPCQFEKCPSVINYLPQAATVYYCHEPLRLLYEEMPHRPYEGNQLARRRALDSVDPVRAVYYRTLKRRDRRNIRRARTVLANSAYIREVIKRVYHVTAEVSYLGVDTERFRPLGLRRRDMVLSVGSLSPLKGFDFLVRAMATIPADRRPVLTIASNFQNGQEKAYLTDLARENGVKLELLNNISDEHLVALYNQATMTVYAPIREPFGLVPLESMACETPVVGVLEGGLLETIVDRQTGVLVQRSEVQFGDAARGLFCRPDLAAQYGRSGRAHVLRDWTWERAVARLEAHLTSCAEGSRASEERKVAQ